MWNVDVEYSLRDEDLAAVAKRSNRLDALRYPDAAGCLSEISRA